MEEKGGTGLKKSEGRGSGGGQRQRKSLFYADYT